MIIDPSESGLLLIGAIVASVVISGISLAYVRAIKKMVRNGVEPEMKVRPVAMPPPQAPRRKIVETPPPSVTEMTQEDIDPLNPYTKKKRGGMGFMKKNKQAQVQQQQQMPAPSNGEVKKWRF